MLLSLPAETLIKPAVSCRGRPLSAWCIHFGSALLCFTLLLALFRRPFCAAALSLALLLLLVAVNNAKWRALREPFVFSDFALFSQALRYPRLYLPFLGIAHAAASGAMFLGGLYLGVTLEPTLVDDMALAGFTSLIATGFVVSALGIGLGILGSSGVSFDPEADLKKWGLLASLWLYRAAERSRQGGVLVSCYGVVADPPDRPLGGDKSAAASTPIQSGWRCQVGRPASSHQAQGAQELSASVLDSLPHVVAVQSESFFDARRLLPSIHPEILAHFDRVKLGSWSGRLTVPAWGANTMRSEFAFLSGISVDRLGVHRFNPYRRFARRPIPSVASYLQSLGYRTVCIHPYPVGFFGRDRVYPNLGFAEFIDIRSFDGDQTEGPYISDAAVTAKVLETLAASDRPAFVFAITMENHGPLHLERVAADDEDAFYASRPPRGFDDLTVYLRHLRNADRMIGDLVRALTQAAWESVLCFFGDHVPSMPIVYDTLDYRDARTDYFVWRRDALAASEIALDVTRLAESLLDVAGLNPWSEIPSPRPGGLAAAPEVSRPGGAV